DDHGAGATQMEGTHWIPRISQVEPPIEPAVKSNSRPSGLRRNFLASFIPGTTPRRTGVPGTPLATETDQISVTTWSVPSPVRRQANSFVSSGDQRRGT